MKECRKSAESYNTNVYVPSTEERLGEFISEKTTTEKMQMLRFEMICALFIFTIYLIVFNGTYYFYKYYKFVTL